jgi:drug/metabolite transporter (DMT)-like permease
MIRHQVSENWRLGAGLGTTTMLLWASLPVALDISLEVLDPFTLSWFRFLAAGVVLGAWLAWSGRLRQYARLSRRGWGLLAIAALGLTCNYVLYLMGLSRTSPGNIQVIIQLGPLFLALGAMAVYGERYTRAQWVGFAALVLGLGIFFRDQLAVLAGSIDTYSVGVVMIVLAAATWACYALAQKQLLVELASPLIMVFIYLTAVIALLPMATPSQLLQLDWIHGLATAYCAINTLVAYSCFAEALNHWQASRVGAVLAVTPLGTLMVVSVLAGAWPEFVQPETMTNFGVVGAIIVVAGSVATSLGGRRRRLY